MAADGPTKNFRGRASFFLVGDFSKKFILDVQYKILHPNIRLLLLFFFIWGTWHSKTGPKSKKWLPKWKNDTKAGITWVCQGLRLKLFRQKLGQIKGLPKKWCWPDLWPLDLWVFGPFLPEKTPNTAKSNCIFHSKSRPDRALIFAYSDSVSDG